ncbi:ABC transporter ATP-binding protein [Bergeyella cardium]|uniref:ATP-binding cassette domain-containing protein n=1 Tax=Bergeyella cardium TaxID=1585976 RepID=A0A6P1QXM2_9FLAO|nr:ABC transporter ATP-binding protein [Bergeyella cardium]QHN65897.1 ATP-binding cassette domain-containing protein [Bergeyella cardium]WHE33501.1 ABC transporter ATP-binding protein [Bergeyella cardium]WHF60151.1 ABC transporter ATP-binding protein [Bergeyella cardium]
MLLEIKNLSFSYEEDKPIFKNLNLSFDKGRIIALAGESGCGKSTLLSLIYGLYDWQEGEIFLEGKPLWGPKGNLVPGELEMKFVAQDYDLMPYATVADNVGKFISNIDLNYKRERVNELLRVVGMEEFTNVKPKFLSGGQQQRVAIARALSVPQKLILLDEPFSNLDYPRKVELRENLFEYAQKEEISMLISTHEIEEIMPWLDEIIILKQGKIVQHDIPEIVYQQPVNEYVAKLFGEVNIFSEEERNRLGISKNMYYPSELRVIEKGGWEAEVLESRFSGSFYRSKLSLIGKKLIIYTSHELVGSVNISF